MPLAGSYFFLEVRFFDDRFFELFFELFFDGTFAPSLRASDSPIAIACFLLVTFLPEPVFRVPRFRSCIALSTFLLAFLLYLAIRYLLPDKFVWKNLDADKHG